MSDRAERFAIALECALVEAMSIGRTAYVAPIVEVRSTWFEIDASPAFRVTLDAVPHAVAIALPSGGVILTAEGWALWQAAAIAERPAPAVIRPFP